MVVCAHGCVCVLHVIFFSAQAPVHFVNVAAPLLTFSLHYKQYIDLYRPPPCMFLLRMPHTITNNNSKGPIITGKGCKTETEVNICCYI